MRLKLIACKALFRELSWACAVSGNVIDVTWMRQGYHNRPELLREWLQREIDAVEEGSDPHTISTGDIADDGGVGEDFAAILLGYGLCSSATAGLTARRHRLVIPRAHDCITLFLGSKERYSRYFRRIPGCFFYTASWIDNANMPGEATTQRAIKKYEAMGYDEETIEYLLTETGGLNNYHNAAYITTPFIDNAPYRAVTQQAARFFSWQYHEIEGRMTLFEKMVSGDWNEDDFLVLNPGESARQSGDERIICPTEAQ